jgi:hypothetical protein
MSNQPQRSLTAFLALCAVALTFSPARADPPPDTSPLSWMRPGAKLISGYLSKPLVLDDERPIYSVTLTSDGKDKVRLVLDPNKRAFNLFGDTTGETEIATRTITATLKTVKMADPAKMGRTLYEISAEKMNGRLYLMIPSRKVGPSTVRLIVRDKAGAVESVIFFDEDPGPALPPCHPGCFPAGSSVETPSGPRNIETIRPGDVVLRLLPDGKTAPVKVASVFVGHAQIVEVETDAGILRTTCKQPLSLTTGTLKAAADLHAGDEVARWKDGKPASVKVRDVRLKDGQPVEIFNLVLEESGIFVVNGYQVRSKPPPER